MPQSSADVLAGIKAIDTTEDKMMEAGAAATHSVLQSAGDVLKRQAGGGGGPTMNDGKTLVDPGVSNDHTAPF